MASIGSIVNAAGNIANTLFDQGVKQFYSIRDFYNFIKKRQNAPMPMRHFAIICSYQLGTLHSGNDIPKIWNYIFKETNLARFSLLAQSFNLPVIKYSGTSPVIDTIAGKYQLQPTGTFSSESNTITIKFLQTAKPIVETFIVPWCYQCLRTNNYSGKELQYENAMQGISTNPMGLAKEAEKLLDKAAVFLKYKKEDTTKTGMVPIGQTPCPKLTLDIKFYRADEIAGLEFLMNPNYIYRITGVYPISFTPPAAVHGEASMSNLQRSVTFAYNNIICLPNAYYQQMLFNGGHKAFMYKTLSPVQILNQLNSAVGGVTSIANQIKSI